MRLSLIKKLMFSLMLMLVFFGGVEVVLRIANVKAPDTPIVVERIMNTDVRYDWLEDDPLLFWKLAGDEPGRMVFRIESLPENRKDELCDRYERLYSSGTDDSGRFRRSETVIEKLILPKSDIRPAVVARQFKPEILPDDLPAGPAVTHVPAAADTPVSQTTPAAGAEVAAKPKMPRLSADFQSYSLKPVKTRAEPGRKRVICLGDSCTFFGHPSYPERLETLLNCHGPSPAWEIINAGVPAYSSYQGSRLYEHRLGEYTAEFVTIYFGWNDHWNARAAPDHIFGAASAGSSAITAAPRLFRMLRLDDAIRLGLEKVRSAKPADPSGDHPPRVPLEEYRINLRRIAATAGGRDTRVIFLTAPHGFDPAHPPEYLKEMSYFDDLSNLIATHEAYNQCVREIAAETGSELVDLAQIVDQTPDQRDLFLQDGIHLSETGLDLAGMRIYDELKLMMDRQ